MAPKVGVMSAIVSEIMLLEEARVVADAAITDSGDSKVAIVVRGVGVEVATIDTGGTEAMGFTPVKGCPIPP